MDTRFSKELVELLFSLRSRTIETKENFRNKYNDNLCDICKLFLCTQAHILQCPEIVKNTSYKNQEKMAPEMIYGNTDQQLKIIKVYQENLSIREHLLKTM